MGRRRRKSPHCATRSVRPLVRRPLVRRTQCWLRGDTHGEHAQDAESAIRAGSDAALRVYSLAPPSTTRAPRRLLACSPLRNSPRRLLISLGPTSSLSLRGLWLQIFEEKRREKKLFVQAFCFSPTPRAVSFVHPPVAGASAICASKCASSTGCATSPPARPTAHYSAMTWHHHPHLWPLTCLRLPDGIGSEACCLRA